eukprot:499430_1
MFCDGPGLCTVVNDTRRLPKPYYFIFNILQKCQPKHKKFNPHPSHCLLYLHTHLHIVSLNPPLYEDTHYHSQGYPLTYVSQTKNLLPIHFPPSFAVQSS